MFTLHHGFWIYFFSRRHRQVWQFVAGSMLPDYIYFILLAIMLIRGQLHVNDLVELSPGTMMTFLPMYPRATQIDLIGHSVVVWSIALILSLLPWVKQFQAFVIGWGTHLLIDGLTHSAYANFYLYPLSLAAVHSPVSYWEPQYFAAEYKMVNNTLMAAVAIYLIYKWLERWWKEKEK